MGWFVSVRHQLGANKKNKNKNIPRRYFIKNMEFLGKTVTQNIVFTLISPDGYNFSLMA